jgi:hypothetical protein
LSGSGDWRLEGGTDFSGDSVFLDLCLWIWLDPEATDSWGEGLE